MFQCWEFTNSTAAASNASVKSSVGKRDNGKIRQQRKLVFYEKFGLVSNILFLLVLFLFLSIHCIGLAQCGQVSPSSVNGLGKAISSSSSSSSSGKDGASRSSGSVRDTTLLDDGELLSHHQHNYHRHHRHSSSSGKNSPQSSSSSLSSSSTSASYGYQQELSPLSYYNPDAYYEPRYNDRPSREFSARSTSYPAMAAAASTAQVGFAEPEYGGLALATGHGGHGGGHGHGHGHGHGDGGYGHGHHTTYYKTVNKLDQSSLGLLGLLGLLSLLSNVLMLLTTTASTTTMAGRRKRDTMMLVKLKDEGEGFARRSVVERLSRLILPSLNVVGHAKDGRIPLNCTYQEVCKTNKALVQVFGADDGRPVASVLSTAITKLLTNSNDNKNAHQGQHKKGSHSNNGNAKAVSAHLLVKKLLTDAGYAGRNGEDCELIYPTCSALSDTDDDYSSNGIKKSGGSIRLPFLVSPEHALAIIMGQSSSSSTG